MSNGKTYPDETKAVVMAALLTGQSVSSVAKEYDIPKQTVSGWNKLCKGFVQETTQKRELPLIGDKLVDLLMTEIESLTQISITARDPAWVKRQDASQLAVYVGVKHDKLFRMLEAFNKNNDSNKYPED